MPRSELNNPTERIGRLLDEFEELNVWAEAAFHTLSSDQLSKLPDFPFLVEFKLEKQRRTLTYNAAKAARAAMRRSRERIARGFYTRPRKQFFDEAEVAKAIHKEITEKPADLISTHISQTTTEVEVRPPPEGIDDPFGGGLSEKGRQALEKLIREGKA